MLTPRQEVRPLTLNPGSTPDIYTYIAMSGCVGMGHSALRCPVSRDAVETALLLLLLSKKQSVERVYTCKMLR